MKAFFKKRLVSLKRSPHMIPLFLTLVCCIIFTFSLSTLSLVSSSTSTASRSLLDIASRAVTGNPISGIIQSPGIFLFGGTLFSIMLVISFLAAYRKGKRRISIFVVCFVMIALIVLCDICIINSIHFYAELNFEYYITSTSTATAWYTAPGMDATKNEAISLIILHLVVVAITTVVILLLPLIAKALNKINTSVDDEYDKLMEQKSEEELFLEIDDKA